MTSRMESKILPRIAAGMPGPVSSTEKPTLSSPMRKLERGSGLRTPHVVDVRRDSWLGRRSVAARREADGLRVEGVDLAREQLVTHDAAHGAVRVAQQRPSKADPLAQIAARAGLTRSAAQRLVHTFRKLGYLTLSEDGRGFRLDLQILDLTHDYLRLNPLVRRASPVLLELRRNVRERVDLSLFDGRRMVYAARMQSKRETFFATLVGNSVPTACTSGGWAVMAMLPDDEVDAILEGQQIPQIVPGARSARQPPRTGWGEGLLPSSPPPRARSATSPAPRPDSPSHHRSSIGGFEIPALLERPCASGRPPRYAEIRHARPARHVRERHPLAGPLRLLGLRRPQPCKRTVLMAIDQTPPKPATSPAA